MVIDPALVLDNHDEPELSVDIMEHKAIVQLEQLQQQQQQQQAVTEETKPAPVAKKRRPVCGVAALRRQSLLHEALPVPALSTDNAQESGECTKLPETLGKVDENPEEMEPVEPVVEIVEMNEEKTVENTDMAEMEDGPIVTPPKSTMADLGAGDDFYTPAAKVHLMDTSLYETPAAVKPGKLSTPARFAQSVTRRRHYKTPAGGSSCSRRQPAAAKFPPAEFEIVPVQTLETDAGNVTIIEEVEENLSTVQRSQSVNDKENSRCVIS